LNRAALAEGLVFAERIGIDMSDALQVLTASAAYSRIMDAKGPKMVGRDYAPQARLSQHLKDVRLIQAAGRSADIALPLTTTHQQMLELAENRGFGDHDNCAVIEAWRPKTEIGSASGVHDS
jgi:3-hydroxyisobutyrate dehydrogenase-like beta-hydroxyacid dehydrogenase